MASTLTFNPFTSNFDYLRQGGGGGGGNNYPGGVVDWVDVTSSSQPLAFDTGYTANNPSVMINFILPAICPYGKIFRIVGKNIGLWYISQNAGQIIHYGNLSTTVGIGGSLVATHQYDAIELLCTNSNSEFTIINGPQGNLQVI